MQKQEILNGKWNYLIILDACRYDSLKEHYPRTQKRQSRGSCTTEWLYKTFITPMKDVTYISTNPFINNKNMPLNKTTQDCKSNWNPTEMFKEVIDVWLTNWDENKETVQPQELIEIVKKHKEKKLIIHFIQPHEPYLTYKGKGKKWIARKTVKKGLKHKILMPVWKRLGFKSKLKVKKILGVELSQMERIYDSGDTERLKALYNKNLEIVLESVEEIIKDLKGTIIITSDHGEALGEKGEWGHPCNSKNEVLRTVPWLEIRK